MLKGASRALLEIVEREMHEAWRKGYEEGRNEIAASAVPEIIAARFGPEARELGASVLIVTPDDRLADLVVRAATCTDFATFHQMMFPRRRRRKG
jgi:hypothetical protein